MHMIMWIHIEVVWHVQICESDDFLLLFYVFGIDDISWVKVVKPVSYKRGLRPQVKIRYFWILDRNWIFIYFRMLLVTWSSEGDQQVEPSTQVNRRKPYHNPTLNLNTIISLCYGIFNKKNYIIKVPINTILKLIW